MAIRFDKPYVNGPAIWWRMQQTYDLKHAERRLGDGLEKIPAHAAP